MLPPARRLAEIPGRELGALEPRLCKKAYALHGMCKLSKSSARDEGPFQGFWLRRGVTVWLQSATAGGLWASGQRRLTGSNAICSADCPDGTVSRTARGKTALPRRRSSQPVEPQSAAKVLGRPDLRLTKRSTCSARPKQRGEATSSPSRRRRTNNDSRSSVM